MSQIIREVNEELYGSAVRVAIDGYTMSDFVMPYLQFTRPASCLSANDNAGVGHGVGQGIGAAIGDLENGSRIPFLALMGDSGMMNAAWISMWRLRINCRSFIWLTTTAAGCRA